MISSFSGTLSAWLLGSMLIATLVTTGLTVQALREAKFAPYFFLRRQAQQRMQSFSLVTLVLILGTVGLASFIWNPPQDTTPLTAVLTNAKPADAAVEEAVTTPDTPSFAELVEAAGLEQPAASRLANRSQDSAELPAEFNRFEPQVDTLASTAFRGLAFSTEIDDQYQPTAARNQFAAGSYTIYATFEYLDLRDGMEWSWVWRYNGQVVGGGNELWAYGSEGPGYIYFSPEEGFAEGVYELDLFINDVRVSSGAFDVAAGAANN